MPLPRITTPHLLWTTHRRCRMAGLLRGRPIAIPMLIKVSPMLTKEVGFPHHRLATWHPSIKTRSPSSLVAWQSQAETLAMVRRVLMIEPVCACVVLSHGICVPRSLLTSCLGPRFGAGQNYDSYAPARRPYAASYGYGEPSHGSYGYAAPSHYRGYGY